MRKLFFKVRLFTSLECRLVLMNEFVLFSSGDVVGGAAKPAIDTGDGLSPSTTESMTMATSDIATASLSTTSCPHSSGDRSHDTTSHVTASGDDLRTTMEALSSGGILSKKHAQLLVSLLSTDDVALLQRALVTIANAAAFTSNQVCRMSVSALL